MCVVKLQQGNSTVSENVFNYMNVRLSDRPPVGVQLAPAVAMALIGNLQLALRHPQNNGPAARLMRQFCGDLITELAGGDPTIELVLRSGEDRQFGWTQSEHRGGQDASHN